MKKMLQTALALCAVAVMAISCQKPLAERFTRFVDKVEASCSDYTSEDWEKADAEFQSLKQEYDSLRESLTEEERDAVGEAMGRYKRLYINSTLEDAVDEVGKILQDAGSVVNGFLGVDPDKQNKD